MYCLFCVVLCIVCVEMCTVLLPPGGYLIAVNKYIISHHIIFCIEMPPVAVCAVTLFFRNLTVAKRVRTFRLVWNPEVDYSQLIDKYYHQIYLYLLWKYVVTIRLHVSAPKPNAMLDLTVRI
jgi:hypothetical protein